MAKTIKEVVQELNTGKITVEYSDDSVLEGLMDAGFRDVDYQEFLVDGTWTKPAGTRWALVEVIAGGGSGARTSTTSGAGGGAGGSGLKVLLSASDLTDTVTVTIGLGGAAVAVDGNGNEGGDSVFGAVRARGGAGGILAPDATTLIGAMPTMSAISDVRQPKQFQIGSPVYMVPLSETAGYGGIGNYDATATSALASVAGNNQNGGSTDLGGGGGGGADSDPSNGVGGYSRIAGKGGNGATNADAQDGSVPGGAGGGCYTASTHQSGAGANGRVRVWAW